MNLNKIQIHLIIIIIILIIIKNLFTSPINLYGKIRTLAKKLTLRDAQAAISAVPDSDVEGKIQDEGNITQRIWRIFRG